MTVIARALVADCPWAFGDPLPGATRGAGRNYPCMSVSEIARFPLPRLDDNCFLFLWYVTSMLDEARFVCRAWGFEPTGGELVWVKTTREGRPLVGDPDPPPEATARLAAFVASLSPEQRAAWDELYTLTAFGMGRTVRNCDERCLIARRGRPDVRDRGVRSVFFAPVGRHSEKPTKFYEIVKRLVGGGPYVELFARRERAGWTTFGNEIGRPHPLAGVAP